MTRTLLCFCDNRFDVEVPEEVDLAADPGLEQAVLSGEFLSYPCPHCGKVLKPEFPILLRDPQAELTVFMIPQLDRGAFFRGRLPYPVPEEADRLVIGFEELAEKLRLRRAGLDDRVVEVLKYYLLDKALESYEGDQEVRIRFAGQEGDSLTFHAWGLKEQEVGVLRVPMDTVRKMARQLESKRSEEPFATILRGPYISVEKLYEEAE